MAAEVDAAIRKRLDGLYAKYNRREFVHPDPLEFLYNYGGVADREVVGLVASSLAYGRVVQILRSVGLVLELLGPEPTAFLERSSRRELSEALSGFRHRFTGGEELAALLAGIGAARRRYGSIEECFKTGMGPGDNLRAPLSAFVSELSAAAGGRLPHLLPSPDDGSACKRLNLFLRWMVRRDDVDPGGWDGMRASMLIVPLDTHMHRVGRALGFTRRSQAGWRTAAEVTAAFREIAPDDPVRYDFALTRLGIRGDADLGELLDELRPGRAMVHA
ncbi:MAG: TIGR02757 family protein [Planctomycetota bacterium]